MFCHQAWLSSRTAPRGDCGISAFGKESAKCDGQHPLAWSDFHVSLALEARVPCSHSSSVIIFICKWLLSDLQLACKTAPLPIYFDHWIGMRVLLYALGRKCCHTFKWKFFYWRDHASPLSAICFTVSVSDNATSVISVPLYRYNTNMPSSVHVWLGMRRAKLTILCNLAGI